jgi:hypothetical protein
MEASKQPDSQKNYQERLAFLRAEQIKANFLIYGRSVFVLHCLENWTGFHAHRNLDRLPCTPKLGPRIWEK